MRNLIIGFLSLGISFLSTAQTSEVNINESIQGTLMIPVSENPIPLVILLTGSGPNDRDGNSMMTKNDSHLQLAKALDSAGIATYRYDKRSLTMVRKNNPKAGEIMFDDFVTDARAVIDHFADDSRFSKIIIAGHSQGSLVGMLALDNRVDKFISIAGAGEAIDKVIVSQLKKQMPGLDVVAENTFQKMRSQEEPVQDVNPYLQGIAGTEIQPFMESWMFYEPSEEIAKLRIPTLIINGTLDVQTDTTQAELLHAAAPNADLSLITGMNHVLKQVPEDEMMAQKSYTDPSFKIHPELIQVMVNFIKKD